MTDSDSLKLLRFPLNNPLIVEATRIRPIRPRLVEPEGGEFGGVP